MANRNKIAMIREFASMVVGEKVVISKERNCDNNWYMNLNSACPRLCIPKNIDSFNDDEDIIFRNDFIARCPVANMISDISLTILHECGHWMTKEYFDAEEYVQECEEVESMEEYLLIPCEFQATAWAIAWLNIEENFGKVIQFEKLYFNN